MIFGKDLTNGIKIALAEKNVFVVTDENVFQLYKDLFPKKTFVIKPGEDQKHLGTVADICAFLHTNGAERQAKVLAVGGGVVGDISGFAASVYMRGIPWANVPTSLLALCDSSIGGKTGVDLGNYKNIIGTFHFPQEVYLSAHFIKTLPEREFICGIGEIIKTACLSSDIFAFFTKNAKAVYQKDEVILERLIRLCAEFKDFVVKRDPYEKTGLRKTLNYGHTVGHAFEAADNHRLSHGAYVLHGIRVENLLCKDIVDPVFFEVAERLVNDALGGEKTRFDINSAVEAAAGDKKNADGKISVMAIIRPNEYREVFFTKNEFRQKLSDVLT